MCVCMYVCIYIYIYTRIIYITLGAGQILASGQADGDLHRLPPSDAGPMLLCV